jgi:hypothetical protein
MTITRLVSDVYRVFYRPERLLSLNSLEPLVSVMTWALIFPAYFLSWISSYNLLNPSFSWPLLTITYMYNFYIHDLAVTYLPILQSRLSILLKMGCNFFLWSWRVIRFCVSPPPSPPFSLCAWRLKCTEHFWWWGGAGEGVLRLLVNCLYRYHSWSLSEQTRPWNQWYRHGYRNQQHRFFPGRGGGRGQEEAQRMHLKVI